MLAEEMAARGANSWNPRLATGCCFLRKYHVVPCRRFGDSPRGAANVPTSSGTPMTPTKPDSTSVPSALPRLFLENTTWGDGAVPQENPCRLRSPVRLQHTLLAPWKPGHGRCSEFLRNARQWAWRPTLCGRCTSTTRKRTDFRQSAIRIVISVFTDSQFSVSGRATLSNPRWTTHTYRTSSRPCRVCTRNGSTSFRHPLSGVPCQC